MIKILLSFLMVAFAQDARMQEQESLEQAGKLFVVKLTPKDKILKFEFVGKKAAEIDFTEQTVSLFLLNGSKRELVRLQERNNNVFETEPLSQYKDIELELKTTIKNNSESFKFRLP